MRTRSSFGEPQAVIFPRASIEVPEPVPFRSVRPLSKAATKALFSALFGPPFEIPAHFDRNDNLRRPGSRRFPLSMDADQFHRRQIDGLHRFPDQPRHVAATTLFPSKKVIYSMEQPGADNCP
jgi:hypothetical protein